MGFVTNATKCLLVGIVIGFFCAPLYTFLFVKFLFVVALVMGLKTKNFNRICKSKKLLIGRTVIVTGGTTGMGLEIANDMAHRGAKVIIACPFLDEGLKGKKRIEESSKSDKVIFKLLDLSSLKSVREFASDILKTESRLDILVNNAGLSAPRQKDSVDGFSTVMQVNYYGTFLLTLLLLPLLKKTGEHLEPSRIVNTTSMMRKFGKVDFANWNNNELGNRELYCNSKLYLSIFTNHLSNLLKDENVVVNAVDPGAVGTAMFNSMGPFLGKCVATIMSFLSKTPWEGAQTALYMALSNSAGKVSGKCFMNCQVVSSKIDVCTEETATRLWNESLKLLKIKDDDWNYVLINDKQTKQTLD